MNENNIDQIIKVIMIGDSGAGKSSLLLKYCNDNFSEVLLSTIGVDFKNKFINHKNKLIKLQVWDTAGQERFKTITKTFYRNSHGVIIVYDVTNQNSFDNVEQWMQEIATSCSENEKQSVEKIIVGKIIVGNKIDKISSRCVSFETGKNLAKKYNCKFLETSAKTGENVINLFESIVEICYDNCLEYQNKKTASNTVSLSDKKKSNKSCC